MNPGEHPLEEEITNVGYLITGSRLPTPSQWMPKEMSRPACDPQMQGAFARACGVRHSGQCATMSIAGSVWTVLRPALSAKESLAKRTQGTDPRTGELKRAIDETTSVKQLDLTKSTMCGT